MPFQITRNDISNVTADAIVNSTSPRPKIGYGTDMLIHKKAGPGLLAARMLAGNIPIGSAAVTGGFRLNAKYVIHTAAPVWQGGNSGEEALLRSCYTRCLELAAKKNCRSIAFPLIGSGNLGFPKATALQIALGAIGDFLLEHEMEVSLIVFDRDAFRLSETLFQDVSSYIDENYVLQKKLEQYGLDDPSGNSARQQMHILQQKQHSRMKEAREEHRYDMPLPASMPAFPSMQENSVHLLQPKSASPSAPAAKAEKEECAHPKKQIQEKTEPIPFKQKPQSQQEQSTLLREGIASTETISTPVYGGLVSTEANFWSVPAAPVPPTDYGAIKLRLEDLLRQEDAGFSETVLRLIDESGKKDSEIYTRANISRQHFSKIRNNPGYKPTKPTAIALAIALELDMEQTIDLIGRAGYALTRSSKFDLIIMYFIQKKNYNLFDINATLFEFDQHLLGA